MKRTYQVICLLSVSGMLMVLPVHLNMAGAATADAEMKEESYVQSIKRKTREWLRGDAVAQKDSEQTGKSKDSSKQSSEAKKSSEKSDGRKVVDAVKDRMQKSSDNISDSMDRDKKTLKKKFDKWFGDK